MTWSVGQLAVCIRAYANIPIGTVLRVRHVGKTTLEFEKQKDVVVHGLYSMLRFAPAPAGTPEPEPEEELSLPYGYGMWMRDRAKIRDFGQLPAESIRKSFKDAAILRHFHVEHAKRLRDEWLAKFPELTEYMKKVKP